jgi:hypothetical protein
MLKNRIVVTAIILCLAGSSVSQAAPLRWIPGPDVLVKLVLWWGGAPAVTHPTRSPRSHPKSGCGIDPNGGPACGG